MHYHQLTEFQLDTLRANRTGMKFIQVVPNPGERPTT